MHAVICGTPNPPLRGFIDRILTAASNGTDAVFYQCNPGLLPEGELRAVCASNGSWYPDPMDLICRERGKLLCVHLCSMVPAIPAIIVLNADVLSLFIHECHVILQFRKLQCSSSSYHWEC